MVKFMEKEKKEELGFKKSDPITSIKMDSGLSENWKEEGEIINKKCADIVKKNNTKLPKWKKLKKKKLRKKLKQQMLYKIPLLGNLILKKHISQGMVVCDITMPNQRVQSWVVQTSEDVFEIKIGDSTHFFFLPKVTNNPEKYIRYENGSPVVLYNWNYPEPISILPEEKMTFNIDTYGALLLRQRAKAAAKPIEQFLQTVNDKINQTWMFSLVAAIGGLVSIAVGLGFIKIV